MAVTGYSIQALRNEVHDGGGPTDMAHYGQAWFARNNCSLSEFLGRSWWKSVYVGYNIGAPWVNFNVPDRGGHDVRMLGGYSETTGGNEHGNGSTTYYYPGFILFTNTGAWNSFNYVNITGGAELATFNIVNASFSWNGSYWACSVPYPGPIYGATMFYAPI